jgi:hypothetical protein
MNQPRSIFVVASASWIQTSAPAASWTSIASSFDGTRLVATIIAGGIYTSTNSSVTWTASSAPLASWKCVASSFDGTRLAAGINSGNIYTSTNRGITWALSGAPSSAWFALASSTDGSRLAGAASGNGIFTSLGLASSLPPGTTYHFQAVAMNSAGSGLGGDLTFTTSGGAPW